MIPPASTRNPPPGPPSPENFRPISLGTVSVSGGVQFGDDGNIHNAVSAVALQDDEALAFRVNGDALVVADADALTIGPAPMWPRC